MSNKIKAWGISLIAIVAILVVSVSIAKANPTYIGVTAQTADATSSPAFIGVGTATSTVTYDSYAATASTTALYYSSPLKAALLVQFTASSTSSVLAINLQYSNDGIDWYSDAIAENMGHGTSTTAINLATTNSIVWQAASTARTLRIITVPTPTRYVRAVSSLTGAAGSVWLQIAPVKESR